MNYGAAPNADYNAEMGDHIDAITIRRGGRCQSVHVWSDQQCVRNAGHDGYCYGKAQPGSAILRRAEWISENGKFKSHHQYATIYPRNAE